MHPVKAVVVVWDPLLFLSIAYSAAATASVAVAVAFIQDSILPPSFILPAFYAGAGMGIEGVDAVLDFASVAGDDDDAATEATAGPFTPPSSSALRTSSANRELDLFKRTWGRSNSTRRPFLMTKIRSESKMVSNLHEANGGQVVG